MVGYINVINNHFLDIAAIGTNQKTLTAQVAVTPFIGSASPVTSGLLVNPAFSLSSGTFYGEQITPQFNPGVGNTYSSICALSIAPTITPASSGLITNLFGLNITGPVLNSGMITNAYSLFVTNASGTVTNNYTAVLGDNTGIPRVGIGMNSPTNLLDVSGAINTYRVYTAGITENNQLTQLSQGYNQSGLGGGSVGTIKTMSQNTTSYFDTALLNGASKGFYGGIFDGRFIYFVPNNNSLVTRYDTVLPFSTPISYTCFDMAALSSGSTGFRGGVFDGKYVYFVPGSGTITRYDSTNPFLSLCSYTCFDFFRLLGIRLGYQGAVFDGRYVYYVPGDDGALFHGTVIRYDTTLSFTAVGSYTSFDMKQVSPSCVGFLGGAYDGRYVYYVPYKTRSNNFSGTIARYDTTLSFTAPGSYTCFDLTLASPDCSGYRGAVFDGRFIYFSPYQNNSSFFGRVARYDTLFSFTSVNSYTSFDTAALSSGSRGFFGAVFDGRYIYFVPSQAGANDFSGTVTRFDTTLSFIRPDSYSFFDTSTGNAQSKGFIGGICDGRYVYLMPNSNGSASGEITRLDSYPGSLATSMAANQATGGFAVGTYVNEPPPTDGTLIVSGNVGVNRPDAQYELDVNGSINITQLIEVEVAILGTTAANQHINVAQGYVQGGFNSGSAGVNKPLSLNTTEFFDTTANVSSGVGGFAGGVYDGRFVYFVPYSSDGATASGTVMRYDTFFRFTSASSYTCFDLTQVSTYCKGFYGGVYDGRYVYFVPFFLGTGISSGTIVRYDTTTSFVASSSYSPFNTNSLNIGRFGFIGGVYDGRYIYYVPAYDGTGRGSGTILRYDTTLSFTISSSYSVFNVSTIQSTCAGFHGGVYDGRYVYFVPSYFQTPTGYSGTVARYDTTGSFAVASSYSIFNLQSVARGCYGFKGAVFDNRYVYYVPGDSTTLTRYDTLLPFNLVSSYTTFNFLLVDSNHKGSNGALFDGRYIYFGIHGTGNSTITRYDTLRPFNLASSYTALNISSGTSNNFQTKGMIFDGRYVYIAPSGPSPYQGIVMRLDAYPGQQATAMAASQAPNGFAIGSYAGNNVPLYGNLIVGGRVGVNTTTPAFDMDVSNSATISVSQSYLSGLLGSTIDNQALAIAEGYNQGGIGGGSVGTNKTMSLNTTAVYDLSQGQTNALGTFGAGVFDGRYIYCVPWYNHGTVVRYDTLLPFAASSSYRSFDLKQLNTSARSFVAGLYDGRYIYFIPFGAFTCSFFCQYDTTLSFTALSSYTIFDLLRLNIGNLTGYGGGAFDGRYIYLAPNFGGIVGQARNGTIVRYDTTLSFTATVSYSTFDISRIGPDQTAFFGATFDGRYVYFAPYIDRLGEPSGSITRYDTALSFGSPASYTVFNLKRVATACNQFYGNVFDGRYVYYIPCPQLSTRAATPMFTRYDTTQSFLSVSSYSAFNLFLVDPTNTYTQLGAVFDGRYIYFAHGDGNLGSTVVRFDTTQPFNTRSSYTCLRIQESIFFRGLVSDGRYIYFMPGGNATIVRIDAYPGPLATSMAANQAPNGFVIGDYVGSIVPASDNIIVGGQMGVGTNSPQYTLDVYGTLSTNSMIFNAQPAYATGGTTRNQLITLAEGNTQGFGSGSVGTNKQMGVNTSAVFDTSLSAGGTINFSGGVFDGRYIYLVPTGSSVRSGTVTRYDTTQPFTSLSSYSSFDMTDISPECRGYTGAVFDGRYVYFTTHYSATMTRYDTYQAFNSVDSYATFNLSQITTKYVFSGGSFDGRYIYFCGAPSSVILCYDTTLSFNSSSSYQSFNTAPISVNGSFGGVTFDGRYIYYAPTKGSPSTLCSTIVRYDTSLPFSSIDSYMGFNLNSLTNINGLINPIFDGRYVFFLPLSGYSTSIVRYDSLQPFTLASSYTTFSLIRIDPSNNGVTGGIFDGRYVYYVCNGPSQIRYDTTQSFNSVSSYTTFNTTDVNALSTGFTGVISDGRYVYLVPTSYSYLTRLDAYPGPQATAMAASQAPNGLAVGSYAGTAAARGNLIISGNFGIGTATPTFSLQIATGTAAKPGGGTWTAVSDARVKQNIEDLSNSLGLIRQLRPRKFQLHPGYAKEVHADPDAFYYGFVADEVESVMEGCVSTSSIHCYGGQENGAALPLPDLMNLKTLNIQNILVHSIQAVKDLADQGSLLKQQIDEL
jgi:hypothetical protein